MIQIGRMKIDEKKIQKKKIIKIHLKDLDFISF